MRKKIYEIFGQSTLDFLESKTFYSLIITHIEAVINLAATLTVILPITKGIRNWE